MKILLSVKPEYIDRILTGTKRYEYRRKLATKPIEAIILYATDPVQKVVGEVEVLGTISAAPTTLWEQTKHAAGIARSKYREYFRGLKNANAYVLGQVTEYPEAKSLDFYGIKGAPQSFRYLDND